jgi:UPF0716 family protein affecting phage T7 exclusion
MSTRYTPEMWPGFVMTVLGLSLMEPARRAKLAAVLALYGVFSVGLTALVILFFTILGF